MNIKATRSCVFLAVLIGLLSSNQADAILLVESVANPSLGLNAISDWFRGGTLQRATVGEWNRATEANKLATCGDWISAWERQGLTQKKYDSMEELRTDAEELRRCCNEAFQGLRDEEKVNPYAVMCAQQLNILKRG